MKYSINLIKFYNETLNPSLVPTDNKRYYQELNTTHVKTFLKTYPIPDNEDIIIETSNKKVIDIRST